MKTNRKGRAYIEVFYSGGVAAANRISEMVAGVYNDKTKINGGNHVAYFRKLEKT